MVGYDATARPISVTGSVSGRTATVAGWPSRRIREW